MAGDQSESHVECGDVGTWVVLCIIGNLSGGGEVRWSNYITTLHFTFSGTAELHLPLSEHPDHTTALDGVIGHQSVK